MATKPMNTLAPSSHSDIILSGNPVIVEELTEGTPNAPDKRSGSKEQGSEDLVCDACPQLDFQKAFKVLDLPDSKVPESVLVANVGRRFRNSLETSSCGLCRLFSASRLVQPRYNENLEYDEIRAYKFLQFFEGTKVKGPSIDGSDYVYLQLVPGGFADWTSWFRPKNLASHASRMGHIICSKADELPTKDKLFAIQDVPRSFDPALARQWIDFCKTHHEELCSRVEQRQGPGLRAIDCGTGKIMPCPEDAAYVALSYVWGEAGISSPSGPAKASTIDGADSLPSPIPNVVADAMQVTLSLGYKYLWVDKYCIEQDNAALRLLQIQNMNSVYENADLTIIAAAGDQHHGLPGVGHRPRTAQGNVKFKDFIIRSTMRHPDSSISCSKWNSRGWTYQEAVLSRRKLVFLDEQVYFQCYAMGCYESLAFPMRKVSATGNSDIKPLPSPNFFGSIQRHLHHIPWQDTTRQSSLSMYFRFVRAVQQYSARDLSYDEDALNAFAGVATRFERHSAPVSQVVGIPFLPSNAVIHCDPKNYEGPAFGSVDLVQSSLCYGLSWKHVGSGLPPPRVRCAFPSWSWAGWCGGITYPSHILVDSEWLFYSKAQVLGFTPRIGSRLAFQGPSSRQDVNGLTTIDLETLHLRAPVVSAREFRCSGLDTYIVSERRTATLYLSCELPTDTTIYEELRQGHRWQCIYLGHNTSVEFLLVLKLEGSRATRAGFFEVYNMGSGEVLEMSEPKDFDIV